MALSSSLFVSTFSINTRTSTSSNCSVHHASIFRGSRSHSSIVNPAERSQTHFFPSKRHLLHSVSGGPLRALLALSAAAAITFLRRKQQVRWKQQQQVMDPAAYKEESPAWTSKATKKIDSHVHVWASAEEAEQFPYFPGQEPTLPGSAKFLVECMSNTGIDGALIIQPINHKFDHSYVSSVLQKYPGKFVGCCLADPTDGGGGVRELERLISKEGYRAVRFNPYLWPPGEKMTNAVGKAMFKKSGELGAVVGFMCYKGWVLHVDEIEALCSEFPKTSVLIDHFGFCNPGKSSDDAAAWPRLLALARYPQVHVKVSAFFRVSKEPYPYKDTWSLVRELLDTFGSGRLIWGTDFPFIAAEKDCGYKKANQELAHLIAESLELSDSEVESILGGAAVRLFPGAWK